MALSNTAVPYYYGQFRDAVKRGDIPVNQEIEMEILLTFDGEKLEKKYVVYFDPNANEEDQCLFASAYDDNNNLFPVETDEEWEYIQEVIDCYYAELAEEEPKN